MPETHTGWICSLHSFKPLLLLVPFTKTGPLIVCQIFPCKAKRKHVRGAQVVKGCKSLCAFRRLHQKASHAWN